MPDYVFAADANGLSTCLNVLVDPGEGSAGFSTE